MSKDLDKFVSILPEVKTEITNITNDVETAIPQVKQTCTNNKVTTISLIVNVIGGVATVVYLIYYFIRNDTPLMCYTNSTI